MKTRKGDVLIDDKFGTMIVMIEDCPRAWSFAEGYVVDSPDRSGIDDEVAITITNTTGCRVVDNVGGDW